MVGAGLAGLAAAIELTQRGFAVDLFERTRLLGGKATSFRVNGVEVDNGQHVYLACCTEFLDFVRHLSRDSALAEPLFLQERFEALLLAPGQPPARLREVGLPAPWHLLPALLRYRHLPLAARLQVALALLQARRPARPGETFAAWLDRHHQSHLSRQRFWAPFLVPALNAPLEEIAAEDALFVLTTAFLRQAGAARFGYARVPLGRLAEAAARQVDRVYLRTPVARVETAAGSREAPSLVGLVLEDGRHLPYDAVVLAVPPDRLARLLGCPASFGLTGLEDFRSAPIVDVHLWYDVTALDFDFAALLDSPVQWVFQKEAGYLCCSISAADAIISRPSAELVELCHGELAAVLPALRGHRPVRSAVTRDREATFSPTPGLQRPGPRTTCSQVTIAGAWTATGWPATMESAVRSGRAAARALIEQQNQGEEVGG